MNLAAHLRDALREAKVIDLPCRVVLFKPFPNDLYLETLANLPGSEHYRFLPHRDANRPDGTSTRLVLALREERVADLPDEQRAFWRAMIRELCSDDVRELFRAALRLDSDMCPGPMLLRDTTGYAIKPHPDSAMKVCTIQAYLPRTAEDERLGTTFYRKDGDAFEPVFEVPFVPNSAYGFKVTDRSWHGTEFKSFSRPRNSLMMGYFHKPFNMF